MPSRSDFRHRYLSYAELEAQLQSWTDGSAPCRLTSIGGTPEGRELHLLDIGPADGVRPSVWVDGNMHAVELAGSSVALSIADDVLALHAGENRHGFPDHVCQQLKQTRFFVLPRMSPDGAEAVLETGRYVRSSPRDDRTQRQHPHWVGSDIDGDGLALLMRVEDPTGEFVESQQCEGLMVPRLLDDPGPFYKLYPEGTIANFDGNAIPSPGFLSDNRVDLNRNFPYDWAAEERQMGAGAYPTSEPESRAVVDFVTMHPEILVWLNLHTFGGVGIRPLGDKPDVEMNRGDLAVFRQVEAWLEEACGYPLISGFEQFTYEPNTPIRGDLIEYAYHQRGCLAYVIELWDLLDAVEIPGAKRFVERYTRWERSDLERLHRWDREENGGQIFVPWRVAQHPQLGEVEVGGLDPRIGLSNPPLTRLPAICQQQSAAFLRVAALLPSVQLQAEIEESESGHVVVVQVENRGYLGTCGLPSAAALHISEPLLATAQVDGDLSLIDSSHSRMEIGHLDGWGRGRYAEENSIFFMRSRGSTGRRTLRYPVRGSGTIRIKVGSSRVGHREIEVSL